MARDSFLLRIDPQILDAVRRWAEDEFRSVNGQIEYVLRQALRDANRLPKKALAEPTAAPDEQCPQAAAPPEVPPRT